MKPRVILAVVLFLVIPTALLSILAARVLRNREFLLDLHTRAAARNAVHAVAQQVDAALAEDLEDLRLAVAEVLARGGDMAAVGRAVRHEARNRPIIRRPFVFMNPWGFVYPQAPDGAGDAGVPPTVDEALAPALRRHIAAARVPESSICPTAADKSYCFRRLSAGRALYVGYEINMPALLAVLRDALREASGGGLRLMAAGPGFGAEDGRGDEGVVVQDTLSRDDVPAGVSGEADGGPRTSGGSRAPLARGRLQVPLDAIEVVAFPASGRAGAAQQRRMLQLTAWGVLLLVGAIIIGVWVVLGAAQREVRLARSRSDFVIGVSHDLRTPVASMKMLAESLAQGRVSGEAKEKQFLGLMVRECERLSQLVERVLFFVRFGQNALVFQPVPVDPGLLVRDAVRTFNARFQMAAPGGEPPSKGREAAALTGASDERLGMVRVDAGAMTQVLLNLLDNAWKYSRDGEGGRIEVTVSREGPPRPVLPGRGWIAIAVRDRGIGIPPRECKRIFDRFYRGPSTVDSNVSGVGLGLAFCRHVVNAHGGRMTVDSTPGEGSTFTVYLPVTDEG